MTHVQGLLIYCNQMQLFTLKSFELPNIRYIYNAKITCIDLRDLHFMICTNMIYRDYLTGIFHL